MMKKFLLLLMTLAMAIPIWASEHTVTIRANDVQYDQSLGVYYCAKDGVMMTFTDGLDNENYLVERHDDKFYIRSFNYIIRKIIFHCVDNYTEDNLDPFYWGPTTISVYKNSSNPGQNGNYVVTNNGYVGEWTGQTSYIQFETKGKPVRFGYVEIIYDKLDGDIFDLVTNRNQIVDGKTYIIVSQYKDKVMAFKKTDDASYPVTNIVEWVGPQGNEFAKVKVDGNACLFKMENVKDSTIGDYTRKVAWFNTLNGYIRERSGDHAGNLENTTSLNIYARAIMYISATEYNYLCWFKNGTGNATHPIRYDYSDSKLLKIMSTDDTDTRVWLYKLADSYHVYTQCDPTNGGTITLGDGVVEGTSQENETVNFHVGTNWGYRIKQVSVINNATQEVTVLTPENIAGDGNDYSFTMPAADVTVKAEFYHTLFLLGTVNGRTTWAAAGPEFNYDVDHDEYYLDVYFKGFSEDPNGYFNLATATSNVDWTNRDVSNGDWNAVQGRLFAESANKVVGDGSTATLYGDGYHNDFSFKIPAGVYHITVNKEMNQMSITRTYPTMLFNPVSESTVQVGTDVHITSDLQSIVHAIAQNYGMHDNDNGPCEQNAIFYSTTDNWAHQVEQQQEGTVTLTQVGTTTVKSSAAIGQIIVNGQADYTIITEATPNTLTFICDPEGAGVIYGDIGGVEFDGEEDDLEFSDIETGTEICFDVDPIISNEYTLDYVGLTVDDGVEEVLQATQDGYSFEMPEGNVTVTAHFYNSSSLDYYTVFCYKRPSDGGLVYNQNYSVEAEYLEDDDVYILVRPHNGFTFNGHITAIDEDDEPVELDSIGVTEVGYVKYRFTMPAADVEVTAYFDAFTPLQVIEHPDGPSVGKNVTVADELIGTWAAKNYLWAKDQDPQVSNDFVTIPTDLTDYARQILSVHPDRKFQSQNWDQSNWVILDFCTIPGWDQEDDPYNEVANYVDHKIEANSIKGRYDCVEGPPVSGSLNDNNEKVQHIIHLSDWPTIADGENQSSLGYPGYVSDPLEEAGIFYQDASSYMYNHYIPSNFWQAYIGGKYGTAPVEGVTPPNDPNVRMFFMNPKDREVAQVWGVYAGQKTFRDPYKGRNVTGDVFEVYKTYPYDPNDPSVMPTINAFGLAGAFWVPETDGWDYNRRGTGQSANDYGKPTGENALKLNTAYLFHAAITTQIEQLSPVKAPKRTDQDDAQAAEYTPWTHYMVYPLDMPNDGSNWTAVQEIMSQESIEIESIRYYNVMGQESKTPFDGINIRVIRYKDGSMISTKIYR